MEKIKLTRKDAEFIINKSFPGYKGRTIYIRFIETGSKQSIISYWSGGSRSSFKILGESADIQATSESFQNSHPINQHKEDPHWIANKNQILVEHVIFCGKDLGLRIYATPDCVMLPKNLLESKAV